jgi:hypothetical protein
MDEYSKEIKKATRDWYHDNIEECEYRARYNRSSRNASASESKREILINEQNGICRGLLLPSGYYRRCWRRATECDHIIEIRHGGEDCIDFLQMLCHECHCEKTSRNYRRQLCY